MKSHLNLHVHAAPTLLSSSSNTAKSGSPMRVRVSLKLLLVVFIVVILFTTFSYWSKCGAERPCKEAKKAEAVDLLGFDENENEADNEIPQKALDEIDCSINDEYTIPCRRDNFEVYVPFTFLHKYFEVYGKLSKDKFDWQHSYSKVYIPKNKYDPAKVFLWFENYNVEVRDRVKCISGIEGVPVSIQWDARGHFYPIQIAQFGLSHFSKNLTEAPPVETLLEDGDETFHGSWSEDYLKRLYDSESASNVLEFETKESETVVLSVDERIEETTLNCDVMFISNASLTVELNSPSDHTMYKIHYIKSDVLISVIDSDIFYGIGTSAQWKTLTRDLVIDLSKGLLSMQNKRKITKPKNLQVRRVILSGYGRIDNISLSTTAHMDHFFSAANWLVNHQDKNGGWPNMVTRKLSNGMLELSPGWYSAMAQGQAMSLLTRAFRVTGDLHYLDAALRAIKLFSIRSEQKGILTTFLGKYVWYEEYPTIPSSYVLNGFIYSLFGLYDVQQSGTHQLCREAKKLFQNGLVSLKKMLPLFDTGSGSVYDLRHFSLGIAPNLARWDYHSTHINQLLFLYTIHNDPIFKAFSDRWTGYMRGKRAPHN